MHIDQIIKWHPVVIDIHDDMVVYGKSKEGHDSHLLNLMKVIQENSLVSNSAKCAIHQLQISFCGCPSTGDGIKYEWAKFQGIADMPQPLGVQQLQRFLGMISYPSENFSRNLHGIRLSIKPSNCSRPSWPQHFCCHYTLMVIPNPVMCRSMHPAEGSMHAIYSRGNHCINIQVTDTEA